MKVANGKLSITAHKLRVGEGKDSYLDVCSPVVQEITDVTLISVTQIMRKVLIGCIEEANEMHGDAGDDLKITFEFTIPAEVFDEV